MPELVKWKAVPTITAAYPQLFVADIDAACAYYAEKLGFATVFTHGQPPFYGQVKRDAARMNLRCVDRPMFDPAFRDRELLLSAYLPVENVKALFLEYSDRNVDFRESLKEQPWGAQYFTVRDPDGNLITFASHDT
jgi:catechol 2,3-dioxygenase-like lactoylglutathione lyase family enzyme